MSSSFDPSAPGKTPHSKPKDSSQIHSKDKSLSFNRGVLGTFGTFCDSLNAKGSVLAEIKKSECLTNFDLNEMGRGNNFDSDSFYNPNYKTNLLSL